MLSLLSIVASIAVASASAAGVDSPIRWEDIGVGNYRIGPIAFDFGFFALKWYSLAYLAGIILGYWHLSKMIRQPGAPIAQRHADDLFFYATLGIILGGRLGYAIFYAPELLSEPQNLIKLWQGGMSFHGGLLGVVMAIAWVSWRAGVNFVRVCDYISVCVPFGLLFGRLANFMNGELWGREAGPDVPWAMIFPGGGPIARHPSQLYEAALEGLLLAIVLLALFWRTKARWRTGLLVGTFTFGYALARFTVEFYREPDSQLQDFAMRTGLSMGQWLTIPMMAVGLFFLIRALIRKPLSTAGTVPA